MAEWAAAAPVLDSLPLDGSEHTYSMDYHAQGPYLLVSGCSHTAGTGIDRNDVWARKVADDLDLELVNLSAPGASAQYVSQILCDHLTQPRPNLKLVIAQWPNPYRSMSQHNGQTIFHNVHSPDECFTNQLRTDPDSFWKEWTASIIKFNSICHAPTINICFETRQFVADHIASVESRKISIHFDEKISGKTWHFDSAASDGMHHSAACHRKWADRILTIAKDVL